MIVQACKFLLPCFSQFDDVQTPVGRRWEFGDQTFLSEGIEYPAQIAFIDIDLFPDFFCGAVFNMSYFIKHPPFCKREGTIQKVLVKQTNDVCIEPVEAPDLVNDFLFTFHTWYDI